MRNETADAHRVVIPILKAVTPNETHLVGTGFFITRFGHFITAKHVLMDVISRGKQTHPMHVVHFVRQTHRREEVLVRSVTRFSQSRLSDVAIGEIEPRVHRDTGKVFENPVVTLSLDSPPIGSRVLTFAYPESSGIFIRGSTDGAFNLAHYAGILEEESDTPRDSALITFPYYRTSIRLLGGASGGPVFDERSRVFAINSVGQTEADISYMTRIKEILDLEIHDVRLAGQSPRTMTVRELGQLNHIIFDPPLAVGT